MCGLVGFIQKQKDFTTLKSMLEVQSHRGADDSGVYFDETSGVHFGHNRLSIQDLSLNARQPFISECENYAIVYNGEVYNFKGIKKELEEIGYKFKSKSDTEVVLLSFKEWGIECVHKFIGMFAFVVLDKIKKKLFLMRDRAGVKPLYFYKKDDVFIFSSEIKSFLKHRKFEKKQNTKVLPYFFQFGYIPSPYSIYENCQKLEAGHYLEVNLNSLHVKRVKYWDVDDFYQKEPFDKSEREILGELEELLNDAINLRMISDVPVGVFLSGGYDSSLVSAILSQSQQIDTFTIGFDDREFNEAKHAKMVANHLKTNHHEYYMGEKDILDLVETLPFVYDEPYGDSSALPTMLVAQKARQKVKVALSADGGDEAFCGYSKYFFLNRFLPIFSSPFKKSILQLALHVIDENIAQKVNNLLPSRIKQTNIKDKYSKFKRAMASKNKEHMFENASSLVASNDARKFLHVKRQSAIFSKFEKKEKLNFLNQMLAIDYKTFMSDDVLVKVDRATMSMGLEGREPLVDHRIIEYLAQVPIGIKYKNRQGKYLLRQILYKYIPKTLADKPKSGFRVPLDKWLRGELKPLVERYLDKKNLDETIFDIEAVESYKKRFFLGEDFAFLIWFILMYQMWKKRWFE